MSSAVPDGWRAERLGDVSYLITKGTTPKTYTNEGVNFIKVESISTNRTLIMDKFSKVDLETHNLQKRSQLESGDILFSIAGSLGRIGVVRSEHLPANINQALALIRLKDGDIDNAYCIQQLSASRVQSELKNLQTVGAQPNLSLQQVSDLLINCPPLPEQKKIASILTSVDEVIENTQKQIDKLQDLKKATMNELLTKGIGHTDFKDSELGRIPRGWEVVTLNEVTVNHDSKRVPIKSVDRQSIQGKYRYYGASGVIDYVEDYIFDGRYILLGEDGENVLSRNLPLAFIVEGKFWVNNHAHILQPTEIVDIGFLCEYLESLDYKNIASGSAQPKITKSALSDIRVKLPSAGEQQQIIAVLSSIDKTIKENQLKLSQTQSLKKSLMQDLLTGKVRVTVN